MTIIAGMFKNDIQDNVAEKKYIENDNIFDNIIKAISSFIEEIPIINKFWDYVKFTVEFSYINPQLAILLGALVGAPFGYIIIKLIRGGG